MRYESRFHCIEAPCCYQDPKPKLVYVWEPILLIAHNQPYWECPACKATYTRELITKLANQNAN